MTAGPIIANAVGHPVLNATSGSHTAYLELHLVLYATGTRCKGTLQGWIVHPRDIRIRFSDQRPDPTSYWQANAGS